MPRMSWAGGGFILESSPERLERIQRVYTTPLEQLQKSWEMVAEQARKSTNPELDEHGGTRPDK